MFPTIKHFLLPKLEFYRKGEKSPLMGCPEITTELQSWFGDGFDKDMRDKAIEAGISLVGRYAPSCTNRKIFTVMAKFVAFGYIFDDVDPGNNNDQQAAQYKDKCAIFRDVSCVVSEEKEPETKLEGIASEIYRELRSCTNPGPYSRHILGFKTWAESMSVERKGDIPKTFTEYMHFRKDNGGYYGMTSIIECLLDIDVTEVWDDAKPLYDEVYTHMMLTNDLYSFRKEYYAKDTTNVLHFFTAVEGMPFQAAVNRVCGMISYHAANIKELSKRLLKGDRNRSPVLKKYINSLHDMVAGNLAHSQNISRYHGSRRRPVRSGLVVMSPQKTIVISSLPSVLLPIVGLVSRFQINSWLYRSK